jgi:hypothetical protein
MGQWRPARLAPAERRSAAIEITLDRSERVECTTRGGPDRFDQPAEMADVAPMSAQYCRSTARRNVGVSRAAPLVRIELGEGIPGHVVITHDGAGCLGRRWPATATATIVGECIAWSSSC